MARISMAGTVPQPMPPRLSGRTASATLVVIFAVLTRADFVVDAPPGTDGTAGFPATGGGAGAGLGAVESVPDTIVAPSTDRNCLQPHGGPEEGRFKGWPANYGMWGWGDEMVVMYLDAPFAPAKAGGHAADAGSRCPLRRCPGRLRTPGASCRGAGVGRGAGPHRRLRP